MSSIMKLFGATLAAGALASGAAFAQNAPKNTAKPAAPAAPAQQAPAAGADGQAAQQQSGPMRVELKPAQADWTKVCGKDQSVGKEVCYTTRDYTAQADQPPVLAVAVYDVKGDDSRIVRFLMPVGLMLRPGIRVSVDKGASIEGAYEVCFPNGCFAETRIKGPTLEAMKKGTSLNVAVKNQVNQEVTFVSPLEGFGKAFDGPAIDPKVIEEQQKKLQEELQKRAEDERKKLEAQGGTAAPGGAAAPGATPAPGAAAPAAPKK